VPVVVGGIIPPDDAARLRAEGVAAVYTPKDFAINGIIGDVVAHVERAFDERSRRAGAGLI
jgi:(2R)-ethylmalonyl-CoA mutase